MGLCPMRALRFVDRSCQTCAGKSASMGESAVGLAWGGAFWGGESPGRTVWCNNSVMFGSRLTRDFKAETGYFFRSLIVKYRQIGKKVHGCKETNIGDLRLELKASPSRFLRLALSCENCVF